MWATGDQNVLRQIEWNPTYFVSAHNSSHMTSKSIQILFCLDGSIVTSTPSLGGPPILHHQTILVGDGDMFFSWNQWRADGMLIPSRDTWRWDYSVDTTGIARARVRDANQVHLRKAIQQYKRNELFASGGWIWDAARANITQRHQGSDPRVR